MAFIHNFTGLGHHSVVRVVVQDIGISKVYLRVETFNNMLSVSLAPEVAKALGEALVAAAQTQLDRAPT
jgi:hypothetical protein